MSFALRIGLSYLFAKKRANLWAIGFIAVVGVANGVGALLIALGITSGFMDTFRDKVLGVNGHVLVLKYGLDFHEYDDVIETAKKDPRVSDASPFLLNEMMLAKGTRLSGVLVKGIDPERSLRVLDLSDNLVEGTVDGLRLPDAAPARGRTALGSGQGSLDDFLADLAAEEDAQQKEAGAESGDGDDPLPKDAEELDDWIERAAGGEPLVDPDELDDKGARDAEAPDHTPLPAVAVPSPAEMSAFLQGEGQGGLPDEDMERQIFAEEALGAEEPDRVLPGIVLGRSLADNLDIVVGDTVRLVSPVTGLDTSLWEATPTVPRSRDYRVTGIFQAGFHEYDSRLVYIDLYEAQRFYNHGDTASGVEARLHDVDEARLVAQDLEASLGTGPFHTMSWQELNENLFRALEIQKYTVSLVIA
ncbi:MAG: ABC transporter permease, partial [Myxococcales bacterium]|nr:ABC transporter permease [Myxococcales bacterium]